MALNPSTDAQGADQQNALLILRRMQKRQQRELACTNEAIKSLELQCVHDFQPGRRVGPYESTVCTRCGAEQLAH